VSPGFEADLVVVDAPDADLRRVIDALLFDHDAGPVRETWVRGQARWSRV
jgi:guanine deaminase